METLFGNTNEAQVDPCLGMNADGICAGSSLEDCKGAHIVEADCTQRCGGFCISHPITEHPACLCPEGVDSCEGIPEGGACQLNVLLRCVQGTLLGIDCGAQGLTCFPGAEGLAARCGEDGVFDECGAVPSEGGCDGDILIRCEQGQLLFEDCATADQSCIWSDENATHLCQSP